MNKTERNVPSVAAKAAEKLYEDSCRKLAVLFGKKHGWSFEGWVGCYNPETDTWEEGAGGWACYGDWVVPMDEIRADLMECAPRDEWSKCYDASVEEYEQALSEGRPARKISYSSWLKGARFEMLESSESRKARHDSLMEIALKGVKTAKEELEKLIEELKGSKK